MKVLFIARAARTQLPLEQVLAMLKNSKEWHAQYLGDGTYDCIHNFVEGGGLGIANVDSIEAACDLLSEYPGRDLFDWEFHPLADNKYVMDKAISRIETAIERQK
jgi:hypothetical protein